MGSEMQTFSYRAQDGTGRVVSGRIEAPTAADASRELIRQGLQPLAIDAPKTGTSNRTALTWRANTALSAADRVVAMRELSTLLKAGVPLDEALESMLSGYAESALGPVMQRTLQAVREGQSLHAALQASQMGLPPHVLTLVKVGEASGQLAATLLDGAEQLEFARKSVQDLRSALIYPAVLMSAGTLAVLIIFLGVIPKFAPLLRSARGEVPAFSAWLIETAVAMKAQILWIGLGTAAVIGLVAVLLSRADVRQRLLDGLSRVPTLGPWLRDAEVGRWALLMGTMLRNRVPLLEALKLSSGAISLSDFGLLMSSVTRDIEQGRSLHDSLRHASWIPASRLNLIKVGERAGTLDEMLTSLGQMQSEGARERQRTAMALIEPAAILLIGSVIGGLMISVMMVITSLNGSAA